MSFRCVSRCGLVVGSFLAIAMGGCDAPSCDEIQAHVLELQQQEVPEALRGHRFLPGNGTAEAIASDCRAADFSPETRRCLMSAKSLLDVDRCHAEGP